MESNSILFEFAKCLATKALERANTNELSVIRDYTSGFTDGWIQRSIAEKDIADWEKEQQELKQEQQDGGP